jgi:hypothetical protein
VDHRLLVAGLVVDKVARVLLERLPYARDVSVAEDAEAPGEKALLDTVTLDVLTGQKPDQRLGHRQPYRTHLPIPCLRESLISLRRLLLAPGLLSVALVRRRS